MSAHQDTQNQVTGLTVEDPDNQIKANRVKAISNAREEIAKRRIETSEYSNYARCVAMYPAVKQLCVECEPLFKDSPHGVQLWKHETLGSFVEEPPQEAKQKQQEERYQLPPNNQSARLQAKETTIHSLAHFVNITPEFEFTFKYDKMVGTRSDPQKFKKYSALPLRISTAAERRCIQYLKQIGLGIEIEGEPYTADGPPGDKRQ
jgi:hypothetical protein